MNIAAVPIADTWMHGGWGWGWMTLMMIVMVLFWGAVIFGIFWFIRTASSSSSRGETSTGKESPLDVLDRRFAEGAISEDDYQARRAVLLGGSTATNGHATSERHSQAAAGKRE